MNLGTPMATKGLGAASLVLIAGAGWAFVVGPQTSELAAVREETASAVSQNQLLDAQLVKLQAQAKNLAETKRTAGALAAMFPPTADQPGLFEQVTQAAAGAGISGKRVTALTPTPPSFGPADPAAGVQPADEARQELATQTVTVSVEGSYAESIALLGNLERIPRAFLIKDLAIAPGAAPGTYATSVTGDMFVMPPAAYPSTVPVSGTVSTD